MSISGNKFDFAAIEEHQGSVSVIFNFVNPTTNLWDRLRKCWQLRRPMSGHRAGLSSGDFFVGEWFYLFSRGGRFFVNWSACENAIWPFFQDVIIGQRTRSDISLLYQQKIGGLVGESDQSPTAAQFFSGQPKLEFSIRERRVGVFRQR